MRVIRGIRAKMVHPAPNGLVGDHDARPRQELWVRPETAAIRIAPSTKPTMPIREKIKLCQPVKPLRWELLKKSVKSLLISIPGKSRARLAPKHQMGPCCFAAGTVHR